MPKIPNFFVKIVTFIVLGLLIDCAVIVPALAVTQKIQFRTSAGHIIDTTFSYDPTESPQLVREQGQGKTEVIDSLHIDFYQPSGTLIASYDNIVNSIARGTYFEFNFDPATKQLLGNLDLGGESPGEMYLKGENDSDLWLIEVDQSGQERAIAQVISVSPVN